MARDILVIEYEDLVAGDVEGALLEAFGQSPSALGIIAIRGVPGFVAARQQLLPLASRLAALPAEALCALEDPSSSFNFGWSRGKEKLDDDLPGATVQLLVFAGSGTRP